MWPKQEFIANDIFGFISSISHLFLYKKSIATSSFQNYLFHQFFSGLHFEAVLLRNTVSISSPFFFSKELLFVKFPYFYIYFIEYLKMDASIKNIDLVNILFSSNERTKSSVLLKYFEKQWKFEAQCVKIGWRKIKSAFSPNFQQEMEKLIF